MTSEKLGRVKRLLIAFWESRSIELTPAAVKLWLDALSDLTVEQIEVAVRRCSREHAGFVNPAELRKYAPGGRGINDAGRAELAWTEVLAAVRSRGAYETVDFEDRICNAVIRDLGGWEWLCDQRSDQMTWVKKDFVTRYSIVAASGIGDASPLPGIVERQNFANGHKRLPEAVAVPTRLPGHVSAARLAYEPAADRQRRVEQTHTAAVLKALPAPDAVREAIPQPEWLTNPPQTRTRNPKPEPVAVEPEDVRSFEAKREAQITVLQRMAESA